MFVNERCKQWEKLFTTLSFITLDVFHTYVKAYPFNTMLGTCIC